MKTHKKPPADPARVKPARFLVLLPHRESRGLLNDYREQLFSAGIKGAWSFPPAAPLAVLSKSLGRNELREIAQKIRSCTLANDGKINAGKPEIVRCPGSAFSTEASQDAAAIFGPALDLPAPDTILTAGNENILHIFPKAVLCAALMPPCGIPEVCDFRQFSFRAAVITNLVIRPLEYGAAPFSFEWRLGPECWLPAYKRPKQRM